MRAIQGSYLASRTHNLAEGGVSKRLGREGGYDGPALQRRQTLCIWDTLGCLQRDAWWVEERRILRREERLRMRDWRCGLEPGQVGKLIAALLSWCRPRVRSRLLLPRIGRERTR